MTNSVGLGFGVHHMFNLFLFFLTIALQLVISSADINLQPLLKIWLEHMQQLLLIQGGTSLKHYLWFLSTRFNITTFFILINFFNTLRGLLSKRDKCVLVGHRCLTLGAKLEIQNQINLVQTVQSNVVSNNLLCASKRNISS